MHEETSDTGDGEKKDLMPPEDIGEGIANVLLGEIAQSGVVDSTYQVRKLIFLPALNFVYLMIDTGYRTNRYMEGNSLYL
jgi:hypothetical protein